MRGTPRALVTFAGACLALRASVAIAQGTLWETYLDAAKTAAQLATSLNNLAELMQVMGRYPDAEPPYRRALTIREKALGAEHPELATSMNNLAMLYRTQGRYTEAEPLYRRALAIREKALGSSSPGLRDQPE